MASAIVGSTRAALSALNGGIPDPVLRAQIELDVDDGCQRALGFMRTRRALSRHIARFAPLSYR
jgi:hypothetical protein